MSSDPVAEAIEHAAALPVAAVLRLFDRYGRPLEDQDPVLDPVVTLADGSRLGRLEYRAPVDVLANDHFVLVAAGAPALAMPGPLFAAAIAALSRPRGEGPG